MHACPSVPFFCFFFSFRSSLVSSLNLLCLASRERISSSVVLASRKGASDSTAISCWNSKGKNKVCQYFFVFVSPNFAQWGWKHVSRHRTWRWSVAARLKPRVSLHSWNINPRIQHLIIHSKILLKFYHYINCRMFDISQRADTHIPNT